MRATKHLAQQCTVRAKKQAQVLYLRSMIGNSLLQTLVLALLAAAQHAASTANACIRNIATSSNLPASVNHNHQLIELVSQLASDVTQQGGLACTTYTPCGVLVIWACLYRCCSCLLLVTLQQCGAFCTHVQYVPDAGLLAVLLIETAARDHSMSAIITHDEASHMCMSAHVCQCNSHVQCCVLCCLTPMQVTKAATAARPLPQPRLCDKHRQKALTNTRGTKQQQGPCGSDFAPVGHA